MHGSPGSREVGVSWRQNNSTEPASISACVTGLGRSGASSTTASPSSSSSMRVARQPVGAAAQALWVWAISCEAMSWNCSAVTAAPSCVHAASTRRRDSAQMRRARRRSRQQRVQASASSICRRSRSLAAASGGRCVGVGHRHCVSEFIGIAQALGWPAWLRICRRRRSSRRQRTDHAPQSPAYSMDRDGPLTPRQQRRPARRRSVACACCTSRTPNSTTSLMLAQLQRGGLEVQALRVEIGARVRAARWPTSPGT